MEKELTFRTTTNKLHGETQTELNFHNKRIKEHVGEERERGIL